MSEQPETPKTEATPKKRGIGSKLASFTGGFISHAFTTAIAVGLVAAAVHANDAEPTPTDTLEITTPE